MQDRHKTAAWTRQETRRGWRASRAVVALGLAGMAASIAQVGCVALMLGAAIAQPGATVWRQHWAAIFAFAALGLTRAAILMLAERRATAAGAAGRARLRTDALRRMLQAGPALLRRHHSGELTATLVDRIEAMDGLFRNWIPAAALAVLGPALVLICALTVDPYSAVVLLVAGLFVPVGQAMAGIGAAAASRGQFLAMARLQARFLDRVRGIATIVLAGRARDEADALASAADELRRRTMRVLRVAFLSSAALDCAMAGALAVLVLHDRAALLLHGEPAHADIARPLFTLFLVPSSLRRCVGLLPPTRTGCTRRAPPTRCWNCRQPPT